MAIKTLSIQSVELVNSRLVVIFTAQEIEGLELLKLLPRLTRLLVNDCSQVILLTSLLAAF